MLAKRRHRHVPKFDRDGSGLDFGKIEDVVDQAKQICPGSVNGARELGLLFVEVTLLVIGQELRQDEQRVERRAQFMAHVGEEFRLVFGSQRKLFGFLLDRAASHFNLEILGFNLAFLVLEQLRLFLQFLISCVELFLFGGELGLPRLQFLS